MFAAKWARGNAKMTWVEGGLALSAALLVISALRGKWPWMRLSARLAAGFLEKSGELRLARQVRDKLARAQPQEAPEPP
jgi:hypothetical protein